MVPVENSSQNHCQKSFEKFPFKVVVVLPKIHKNIQKGGVCPFKQSVKNSSL